MKKAPKISVLMPAYNSEAYIAEAIESILNQTFSDFEFYICDDGSRDNTPVLLQEYAARDARVKILTNDGNIGIAATRNRLLAVLPPSVKFVAWIDADDICFPDRFPCESYYGFLGYR